MKIQFKLCYFFLIILIWGCKATEYSNGNVSQRVMLSILSSGNAEGSVIEVLSRQGFVLTRQTIAESTFFINYQRIEVEIDLKSYKQFSFLQKELFRIPEVFSVYSIK